MAKRAPTAKQRIRQLVRRGIMPSLAEEVVAATDAAGGELMTSVEVDAAAKTTDADIERSRQWWYYSPLIPARFKRILDARKVPDAG